MEFDLYATAPRAPRKMPAIGHLQWFDLSTGIVATPTYYMLDIWKVHSDALRAIGIDKIQLAPPVNAKFTFDPTVASQAEVDATLAAIKATLPKRRRRR